VDNIAPRELEISGVPLRRNGGLYADAIPKISGADEPQSEAGDRAKILNNRQQFGFSEDRA
jgi:hypothetical protein